MKTIFTTLTMLLLTLIPAVAQRLPATARPENYKLTFTPDLENAKFEGDETLTVRVLKPTSEITLNAVDIDFHNVTITSGLLHQWQQRNLAASLPLALRQLEDAGNLDNVRLAIQAAQETRRLVWAAQSVGVPDPPSFDRVLELRRERFGLKP